MKDLALKTIVRIARTAAAYVDVHNSVKTGTWSLTSPIIPPFDKTREICACTHQWADATCGTTGQGSVHADMIMWSWIRHGTRHADTLYTHLMIDTTVYTPTHRLLMQMMRHTCKWDNAHNMRYNTAVQASVGTYGMVADVLDVPCNHKDIVGFSQVARDIEKATGVSEYLKSDGTSLTTERVQAVAGEEGTAAHAQAVSEATPTTPTPEGDSTMSENTSTPAPVAADLGNINDIMATLNQVPAVVAERDTLRQTVKANEAELADRNRLVGQLKDDLATNVIRITSLDDEVAQVRKDLMTAKANGSGVVNKIAIDDHTLSAQTNDLDRIADKLHITRPELDDQMTAFKQSCIIHLPNAVAWMPWCDPTQPLSKAPFMMDGKRPFVATGPSGTGKTFLLEALCLEKKGARCLVTYHEMLSYAKLYLRERVASGRTCWQLGPVPMAKLCGIHVVHDEIDHGALDTQTMGHSLLDNGGAVHLSDIGLVIYPTDNCTDVFTCNSLTDGDGEYHGEIGTALKTRFGSIFVEYPAPDVEAATIHIASELDKPICEGLANVFKALRDAEKDRKLTGPFSVRESCAAAKVVKQVKDMGGTEEQALTMAYQLYVIDKRPRDEQIVAAEVIQQTGGIETGEGVDADDLINQLLGK